MPAASGLALSLATDAASRRLTLRVAVEGVVKGELQNPGGMRGILPCIVLLALAVVSVGCVEVEPGPDAELPDSQAQEQEDDAPRSSGEQQSDSTIGPPRDRSTSGDGIPGGDRQGPASEEGDVDAREDTEDGALGPEREDAGTSEDGSADRTGDDGSKTEETDERDGTSGSSDEDATSDDGDGTDDGDDADGSDDPDGDESEDDDSSDDGSSDDGDDGDESDDGDGTDDGDDADGSEGEDSEDSDDGDGSLTDSIELGETSLEEESGGQLLQAAVETDAQI